MTNPPHLIKILCATCGGAGRFPPRAAISRSCLRCKGRGEEPAEKPALLALLVVGQGVRSPNSLYSH